MWNTIIKSIHILQSLINIHQVAKHHNLQHMCSQLHDPLYYGEGMGTGAKGMASSPKVWEWSCKDNVGLQDPKAKAKLMLTRTGKTGTKYVNYANSTHE